MDVLSGLQSAREFAPLALRLAVAPSFVVHGLEKKRYRGMHAGGQNTRALLRLYGILNFVEPLAGIALLLGLGTRIAAAVIVLIMMGAIKTRILDWKETFGDDGWELDWILLLSAAALVILGGGSYSLERLL